MKASTHTPSSPANATLAPSQIFTRARPSVVVIVADDQNTQREALGSGFLVSRDRIATNHHVLEGMKEAYVLFSDGAIKRVSGVVADSVQQDLIILRVETGKRPSLPLGDELSLQQGDPVYALGAPKGLELSFTNGIVSSFRKSDAQFLIQTTAAIAPGSSGGPLFDRAGKVVGVTTSMVTDAQGIYFSVGIGDVKRLLRTPPGVALSFDEWAKQQDSKPPSGALNKSAPNQGPSLQDTISWMQDFSKAHGIRFSDGRDGRSSVENAFFPDPVHEKHPLFQKPSVPGCAVWTTRDLHGGKPGEINAALQFFNLGDINPDSVKADEYGNVLFETTDPSGKIEVTESLDPSITSMKLFTPEGWAQGHTIETQHFLGLLIFDSAESAQRFASALKHAVILCGGAASPF
ncbi:MAG: S1C family serine protease [Candidatus Acidiferrales bacterium]